MQQDATNAFILRNGYTLNVSGTYRATQHSAFRGTARHNKTVITYNSTRPTTIRLS